MQTKVIIRAQQQYQLIGCRNSSYWNVCVCAFEEDGFDVEMLDLILCF